METQVGQVKTDVLYIHIFKHTLSIHNSLICIISINDVLR